MAVAVGVGVSVSVGGTATGLGRSRGAATILVIPRQYNELMPRKATTRMVFKAVGRSQKSRYQSIMRCIAV